MATKSMLKNIHNVMAHITYTLSVLFGTHNWGKSFEELSPDVEKQLVEHNRKIIELNNKAWYATGQQLRDACLQVSQKYGINNE